MLNQDEEKKIQEMKDKCRELKVPPPPDIIIGLQVHDNGVLVFDDIQRGHSWTRNFYNLMFGAMACARGSNTSNYGAGYMSMKTYGGVTNGSYSAGAGISAGAGYGLHDNTTFTNNNGIAVGTNDTAFGVEQYTLPGLIAHGNGSGQLYYQAMEAWGTSNVPTYDSGTKTWSQSLVRVFNNNSGGSITVKESGLYYYGTAYASYQKCLVERSVLDPSVAVANGAQLTVTYTISMDFSAID